MNDKPLIAITTGGEKHFPRRPEIYLQAVDAANGTAVFIGPDINIMDRATFDDPYQRSSGINHVLVNGLPVIKEGKFAGNFPGKVLRRSD